MISIRTPMPSALAVSRAQFKRFEERQERARVLRLARDASARERMELLRRKAAELAAELADRAEINRKIKAAAAAAARARATTEGKRAAQRYGFDAVSSAPPPAIAEIVKACAEFYGVEPVDILSARRTANVVRPRQVAMYLAKKMTLHSLLEIGRRMGGKDHTTIIHAIRKIAPLVESNPKLAQEISTIRAGLDNAP